MLINLKVFIDGRKEPVKFSTEVEDIRHQNWNEVMYDLYERYEDEEFADKCDDEKFEMSQHDKLK